MTVPTAELTAPHRGGSTIRRSLTSSNAAKTGHGLSRSQRRTIRNQPPTGRVRCPKLVPARSSRPIGGSSSASPAGSGVRIRLVVSVHAATRTIRRWCTAARKGWPLRWIPHRSGGQGSARCGRRRAWLPPLRPDSGALRRRLTFSASRLPAPRRAGRLEYRSGVPLLPRPDDPTVIRAIGRALAPAS